MIQIRLSGFLLQEVAGRIGSQSKIRQPVCFPAINRLAHGCLELLLRTDIFRLSFDRCMQERGRSLQIALPSPAALPA